MACSTTAPNSRNLVCDIVESVADANGVDPLDLEPSLYDVVDPDALERVFGDRPDGSARSGGRVVFVIAGCEVTVRADRTVEVVPIE